MTKTVSTRIDEKTHQEIIDRCNREGCTVAYFLEAAIQLALTGTTEFNFGEVEEDDIIVSDVSTVLGNTTTNSPQERL